MPQLIARVRESVAQGTVLTFTYAHFQTINIIRSSARAQDTFRALDLVTPDGIALLWTSRLFGARLLRKHVLSPEYTMPVLALEAIREGWSFFLLGGDPGVAARAAERLKAAFPSIDIAGTHHGRLDSQADVDDVIAQIVRVRPTILWVGLGQPKQEEWIAMNKDLTGVSVIIAVGGYLDKLSQRITAYPQWVNRTRLYWLYRLVKEPKRMWKRYTLGAIRFVAHLSHEKYADLVARRRARARGSAV